MANATLTLRLLGSSSVAKNQLHCFVPCGCTSSSSATSICAKLNGRVQFLQANIASDPLRFCNAFSAAPARFVNVLHLCRRSTLNILAAAASSEAGSILPPASQEEAVQQAGAALSTLLGKALKLQGPTTVKQRKSQRQIRLRVDIPLLDDSPQALVTLTRGLLNSFLGDKRIPGKVAVYLPESFSVLPDVAAAAVLSDTQKKDIIVTYLSLSSRAGVPVDAVLALVVTPNFGQAASLDFIARNAGLKPIVVINPDWSEDEEADKSWGPLLTSFCVAYSFIPLTIQVLFTKTEGAVVKNVSNAVPQERPWLIFVKEGGTYKCLRSLKRRPTSSDLENALYTSMAANSPVSKSIRFLRGLVSKEADWKGS